MSKKISATKSKAGRFGGKSIEANVAPLGINYPVFCFKHLHQDYGLTKCTDNEKRALMEKIVQLSQLSWAEMETNNRHKCGSEKIRLDAIRPNIPHSLTADVKHLLSIRFDGMKPMVGHRERFVFHVLFIDREFKVYNHGK